MPLTEKDRELINQLLTGQAGAWSTFVDRYSALIVHVIRHTAHAHSLRMTPDDIDDLTADVFATLLERDMGAIRGFRGRSSFSTYLVVVVRRVVLRKLTQRRYMNAFGHVKAHSSSLEEAAAEGSSVRQVDAKDEVDSLMVGLPEATQKLLRMFHIDGRTYQEISERLSIPMNSIGPALARARSFLQRAHKAH